MSWRITWNNDLADECKKFILGECTAMLEAADYAISVVKHCFSGNCEEMYLELLKATTRQVNAWLESERAPVGVARKYQVGDACIASVAKFCNTLERNVQFLLPKFGDAGDNTMRMPDTEIQARIDESLSRLKAILAGLEYKTDTFVNNNLLLVDIQQFMLIILNANIEAVRAVKAQYRKFSDTTLNDEHTSLFTSLFSSDESSADLSFSNWDHMHTLLLDYKDSINKLPIAAFNILMTGVKYELEHVGVHTGTQTGSSLADAFH